MNSVFYLLGQVNWCKVSFPNSFDGFELLVESSLINFCLKYISPILEILFIGKNVHRNFFSALEFNFQGLLRETILEIEVKLDTSYGCLWGTHLDQSSFVELNYENCILSFNFPFAIELAQIAGMPLREKILRLNVHFLFFYFYYNRITVMSIWVFYFHQKSPNNCSIFLRGKTAPMGGFSA